MFDLGYYNCYLKVSNLKFQKKIFPNNNSVKMNLKKI